jgi:hypothetical protein
MSNSCYGAIQKLSIACLKSVTTWVIENRASASILESRAFLASSTKIEYRPLNNLGFRRVGVPNTLTIFNDENDCLNLLIVRIRRRNSSEAKVKSGPRILVTISNLGRILVGKVDAEPIYAHIATRSTIPSNPAKSRANIHRTSTNKNMTLEYTALIKSRPITRSCSFPGHVMGNAAT